MLNKAESAYSTSVIVEISAEVCYQIGGVHTVLLSKIPTMVETWGDRYFLLGPYLPIDYSDVFIPLSTYEDTMGKNSP